MAAKSSTLSHVSFLMSMMRTKSTRALSFSFYQHFAVQNDQLRLKSSKTVLKAFQLIFPWLKMKWKTLCISNLDSWVDQKKHLNKDAQKKCLWSGDVRWPASIFPFSRITFSSSKKLNFLIQSNIRQVPNILVFLSSCTRPTSFAWLSGRTLSLLQLECSREEECLVRAKNFSARNPQLFSFSSLLTEVPKNRSHPRLIQEYFSCRSSSSSDDARQSYWIVLLWTFSSSSHRAKVLAAISITRQDEAMSSSWGLRRKSLTVIIILGGRLKRRKELVGRFESSLRWRDGSQRWWERTFDW